MDVIEEGKITPDEGLELVLQTMTNLKSVSNLILRINGLAEDVQGKIGFSPSGHVLGGKIDETGETGYSAVRKLLSVREGNYAILNPKNKRFPDLNQTLWIEVSTILEHLPDLPETFDSLMGADTSILTPTVTPEPEEPSSLASTTPKGEKPNIQAISSKVRQFDPVQIVEGYTKVVALIIGALLILLAIVIASFLFK